MRLFDPRSLLGYSMPCGSFALCPWSHSLGLAQRPRRHSFSLSPTQASWKHLALVRVGTAAQPLSALLLVRQSVEAATPSAGSLRPAVSPSALSRFRFLSLAGWGRALPPPPGSLGAARLCPSCARLSREVATFHIVSHASSAAALPWMEAGASCDLHCCDGLRGFPPRRSSWRGCSSRTWPSCRPGLPAWLVH